MSDNVIPLRRKPRPGTRPDTGIEPLRPDDGTQLTLIDDGTQLTLMDDDDGTKLTLIYDDGALIGTLERTGATAPAPRSSKR